VTNLKTYPYSPGVTGGFCCRSTDTQKERVFFVLHLLTHNMRPKKKKEAYDRQWLHLSLVNPALGEL
jgi:hypothetical protein